MDHPGRGRSQYLVLLSKCAVAPAQQVISHLAKLSGIDNGVSEGPKDLEKTRKRRFLPSDVKELICCCSALRSLEMQVKSSGAGTCQTAIYTSQEKQI